MLKLNKSDIDFLDNKKILHYIYTYIIVLSFSHGSLKNQYNLYPKFQLNWFSDCGVKD